MHMTLPIRKSDANNIVSHTTNICSSLASINYFMILSSV